MCFVLAFMVVYFFTLFGFRLSNIFGNALVGSIELVYKFIFRGLIPKVDTDNHNFNTEFRVATLLTSLVTFFHLYKGAKKFHEDLIKLHKGEKFFSSLVMKYRDQDYSKQMKKRTEASASITLDSLHFPGYLVAHLVYGYVLLFLGFFLIIMVVKITLYIEGFFGRLADLLLPIFILFAFKFVVIRYLVSIFFKNDNQRITNLPLYYVLSYFNFFFDCFLGLVACMSRVWETTIISLLYLPRLDTSLFNENNDLLMRRLDKGHLAYLNYVRMEHWYNNQILKGFCEMLLESMFYSQIYRVKIEDKAKDNYSIDVNKVIGDEDAFTTVVSTRRFVSQTATVRNYNVTERVLNHSRSFNPAFAQVIKSISEQCEDNDDTDLAKMVLVNQPSGVAEAAGKSMVPLMAETVKTGNLDFKYTSFLRLRNLIFLCLLLRKNPSLKQYRQHYLLQVKKDEEKANKNKPNQSFTEFYEEKLAKKFNKLKEKMRYGKPSSTYSSTTPLNNSTSSSRVNSANTSAHTSKQSMHSTPERKRSFSS